MCSRIVTICSLSFSGVSDSRSMRARGDVNSVKGIGESLVAGLSCVSMLNSGEARHTPASDDVLETSREDGLLAGPSNSRIGTVLALRYFSAKLLSASDSTDAKLLRGLHCS